MTRATEVLKAEAAAWELERVAGPGGVYHKKLDDLAGLGRCKERTLRKRLAQGEQRGAWVYATKPGNPWAPDPTADAGTVLVLNTGAGDFDPIGLLARALRDCRRRGCNQRLIEILSYALSARERCKDLPIETQDGPSFEGPYLGARRPPVRPRSQSRAASDGAGLAKAAGTAAAPATVARSRTQPSRRLPNGVTVMADAEVQQLLKARGLEQLRRFHLDHATGKAVFAVGEDSVIYALTPFAYRQLTLLEREVRAAGWFLPVYGPRVPVDLIEIEDHCDHPGGVRPPGKQEVGLQGAGSAKVETNDQPAVPVPALTDEEVRAAVTEHAPDPVAQAGIAQALAQVLAVEAFDPEPPERPLREVQAIRAACRVHDPALAAMVAHGAELARPPRSAPDPFLAAVVARHARRPEHQGGRA